MLELKFPEYHFYGLLQDLTKDSLLQSKKCLPMSNLNEITCSDVQQIGRDIFLQLKITQI